MTTFKTASSSKKSTRSNPKEPEYSCINETHYFSKGLPRVTKGESNVAHSIGCPIFQEHWKKFTYEEQTKFYVYLSRKEDYPTSVRTDRESSARLITDRIRRNLERTVPQPEQSGSQEPTPVQPERPAPPQVEETPAPASAEEEAQAQSPVQLDPFCLYWLHVIESDYKVTARSHLYEHIEHDHVCDSVITGILRAFEQAGNLAYSSRPDDYIEGLYHKRKDSIPRLVKERKEELAEQRAIAATLEAGPSESANPPDQPPSTRPQSPDAGRTPPRQSPRPPSPAGSAPPRTP